MQYCYKCRQNLPVDAFSPSKRGKQGVRCSACQREYSREHYIKNKEKRLQQTSAYQKAHREQVREYGRKWREQHPDAAADVARRYRESHREVMRDRTRRWYQQNKEREQIKARGRYGRNLPYYRKWYQQNRDRLLGLSAARYERDRARIADRARSHYQANKVAYRKYYTKRRAIKRAATIGKVDYPAIWERDQGMCYLCGQSVDRADLQFDHVIPLSKGGAHSMENIRVTHEICNKRKAARLI